MDDPLVSLEWEVPRAERLKTLRRSLLTTAAITCGLGVVIWLLFRDEKVLLLLGFAWLVVMVIRDVAGDLRLQLSRKGVAMTPTGFRYSRGGRWAETPWTNVIDVKGGMSGSLGVPAVVVKLADDSQVVTGRWTQAPRGQLVVPIIDVPDLEGLKAEMRRRAGLPQDESHRLDAGSDGRVLDPARFEPPEFRTVRLSEGYDVADVDEFVVELHRRIREAPATATAGWVMDARFTPVRLRPGYAMGPVDEWLDHIATELI